MDHVEKAKELFLEGYNCAQSVFTAFSDVMGIDEKTALRLSSPFGGGMGRMREVCGACSGMFMVLGMLYGYDTCEDAPKKELYRQVQELADKFKEKNNGTVICRELLKNLSVSSNHVPTVRNSEFYKVRPCLKFVTDAAALTEEFINTHGK